MSEIQMANEQMQREQIDDGNVLLRILGTPSVRKALLVGCSMQALSPAAGINTIM